MSAPEYILIIANSGRMLAQAAFNANFKPLVIDLFADLDTQEYAEKYIQVTTLSSDNIALAIEVFITKYAVKQVIYGSGFEKYPESLAYLAENFIVLGNSVDSFVATHDKQRFFAVLRHLNIPYPDVCFIKLPLIKQGWLIKPLHGQGGVGIKHYSNTEIDEPVYWQKLIEGSSHSVLFLANGVSAQIVGFNTQWVDETNNTERFIFSGVMNETNLLIDHKELIAQWLQKLVPIFGLKGLNSLDFIQTQDKKLYVLEINPRPSASMQLYSADLLQLHINSCRGELGLITPQAHYTAYQIVYASDDMTIPEHFNWPEGCKDLPDYGVTCRKGQPICSIIAHHEQAQLLKEALMIKQHNLLKGLNSYGIPSKC